MWARARMRAGVPATPGPCTAEQAVRTARTASPAGATPRSVNRRRMISLARARRDASELRGQPSSAAACSCVFSSRQHRTNGRRYTSGSRRSSSSSNPRNSVHSAAGAVEAGTAAADSASRPRRRADCIRALAATRRDTPYRPASQRFPPAHGGGAEGRHQERRLECVLRLVDVFGAPLQTRSTIGPCRSTRSAKASSSRRVMNCSSGSPSVCFRPAWASRNRRICGRTSTQRLAGHDSLRGAALLYLVSCPPTASLTIPLSGCFLLCSEPHKELRTESSGLAGVATAFFMPGSLGKILGRFYTNRRGFYRIT